MHFAVWFVICSIFYIIAVNWRKWLALYRLNKRFDVMCKDLDGIPGLPFIGFAHLLKWSNVDLGYQLEGWARKYILSDLDRKNAGVLKGKLGPVPLVFLATPDAVRAVLESGVNITKPEQYDIVSTWIGTGLLTSTNDKWYKRRKLLTPAFHFNVLLDYQIIFAQQGEILADVLEKYAETNEFMDCFPFIKRCALDIICETAMGTEMKTQTGQNEDYVHAVVEISRMIWDYERFPWLWFKPAWYLCGYGRKFDKLVKLTNDFTRKVIAERKETVAATGNYVADDSPGAKLAFLDMLLTSQEKYELTDEDIREEVDTFMFEGHDTTSSGMGFTLWYIGQEPDVQRKVHAELDVVFGDSNRLPTPDDIKQLVYLEKCVKEALRMMPSVPLIGRRLSEDLDLGNVVLPEGLTIAISPVITQRDPRCYEKPDFFYPEHFDQDKASNRDHYSYIPFSAGPRNCIGQKFALLEEKTVLSSVLRRYKVLSEHSDHENRPVPELILRPSRGFSVKFFKRN